MNRVALKMLVGDRAKYLALVIGLSFAVLLITQQASIFLGLVLRGTGFLQNISQPDLWVADPSTRYIGEIRPLADAQLQRVRAVEGVLWAEPFFTARAPVELMDGEFKTVQLQGISRSTLVGQPPQITAGRIEDLRIPGAVIVEETSREKLNDVQIGETLKLNDRRAIVVGYARARLGFESNAVIYTTYEQALNFVPTGRNNLTYMLVKCKPGYDVTTVQARINQMESLGAFTGDELRWRTIWFILLDTGIGINFAITVTLGFIVGLVVSAAIFYQFTLENLGQFAVLKAMGATRWTLVKMILLQALLVGLIGYGIGVGAAGVFSWFGREPGAELSTHYPWQLMVGSLVATLVCIAVGSLLSLRRVLTLEPAIVFK
ncbi:ABC transporter permease [Phycisphaerales bacterium AB-hyl4]|uniref:ABC transporter permease n=1 Tax=Natronomicrosphaera hydrolytica TaxID=3242702 RepID=A0ABV4U4A1_9BACT